MKTKMIYGITAVLLAAFTILLGISGEFARSEESGMNFKKGPGRRLSVPLNRPTTSIIKTGGNEQERVGGDRENRGGLTYSP